MSDQNTIDEQAVLLAKWLDEHPGSPAPDGVDPQVIETIYAMRPDLAPAPSFSIDDILCDITAGPFADAGAEVVPLAPEPPTLGTPEPRAHQPGPAAEVVDLAAARRRRWAWIGSGVGAFAAAAMALVVAIPFLDSGIQQSELYQPSGKTAAEAPTAQPTRAEPIPELAEDARWREGAAAKDAVVSTDAAEARGPVPGAAIPGSVLDADTEPGDDAFDGDASGLPAQSQLELGGAAGAGGAGSMAGGQPSATTPSPDQPARRAREASEAASEEPAFGWFEDGSEARTPPMEESVAAADPAPLPSPSLSTTGGEAAPAGASLADFDLLSEDEDEETSGELRGGALTGEGLEQKARRDEQERQAEADDLLVDEADAGASAEYYDRSASAVESSSRGARSSSSRAAGRIRGRDRAMVGDLPTAAPAEPASPALAAEPEEPDALRAQSAPLDYRSDWYLADPSLDEPTRARIAASYAQAQAAVAAGDLTLAIAVLKQLMTLPQPRVVQDAAWRAAVLELQAGALPSATTTVQRGLSADGSPTVYRSRLLSLQGSLLEEQGRAAEAMDAYREADEANDARE